MISGPKNQAGITAVSHNEKKSQEELLAQNQDQMRRLLGTEFIIEKVLKMLDCNPWDDLGNWPADAQIYKGMRLSESKMKNEIDLREPRTESYDKRLQEFPIYSTETGWHSTERRTRESGIKDLGEGTNLYFKFLKYFMLLFLLCTLLSSPIITMFCFGMEYDGVTDQV